MRRQKMIFCYRLEPGKAMEVPLQVHSYNKSMVEDIDYTVIPGDKEIEEGVTAIFTPRHTYGLQGVLVNAEKRRYFIASDTFYLFKNLEEYPPLISGSYVDLRQYYESMEKIIKLSAFILPGHDFKIFHKDVYS
jgi:glyoxylase-like metal-dependent hydrolase (beta-lactamase superfamily II)